MEMSINKHVILHFKNTGFSFILITLLSACGGGGGSDSVAVVDNPVVPKVQSLTGSGVKGPLANADVTVYAFDASKPGFKGAVIDTATTDNSAAIINLALPLPLAPPYIMEFTSAAGVTTDITTGQFPIISTLRTVITQSLLDTAEPLYATPLTTMATDIAMVNADSNAAPYTGNGDGSVTSAELVNALSVAAAQLASTLGFGADVDFFNTPPLIDSTTISVAEQTAVAQYRTAIEALTAVVFELAQNSASPAVSADEMLNELTADLMDGVIDGTVNGSASTVIDSTVLNALSAITPATLPIPGSDDGTGQPLTVDDVEALLISEKATTGSTTDTSALPSNVFTPQAPQLDPDTDDDTVADIIDNCPVDANQNQSDSNSNGVGDVCDSSPVAATESITVNEGATISVLDGGANSVLANDNDAEGDSLNAVLGSDVSNGSLTLNANGTFSYTHDGSETTSDSFSYQANDGSSNSNVTTVNISIVPQNDAPVANTDSLSIIEGGTVVVLGSGAGSVLANDTDAENNPLTAVLDSDVSNGTLTLNADGTFSYTHNGGETGSDSFSYHANDGFLNSGITTVTISVTPQNDAPVAAADSNSVVEDSPTNTATGNVLTNDTDVDGPSLTVSNVVALNNTGTYGTLTISSDGSYSYLLDNTNSSVDALNAGDTLTETYNYTVSDGSLNDAENLVITITGVTDAAGTVDISGVWVVTSTVTSDTPAGCAGGVGDVDVTAMTIAQTGSALTVKTVSGATLTGTIDTVTGDFNLPTGSLSGVEADLTNLANAATLLNWQDSFIVSGSTVSSTSLSGNISTTETTSGVTDCTYSQSFTANFKYKPSGSENFNGVYASESFQEQESLGSFGSSQDALFQPDVVEMAFTATDITVYFPFINFPGLTFTVENNTFDPATGFFNYKAVLKVRSDTDGDPLTIEQSEVSGFVFNGIFLNDPAIDSGSNGSPLILGSSYSYQLEYTGDVDSGGTVNFAKNKTEISYSKRLDTLTRTRTKLVQNADLSTETRIIMGLNNPPLKVSDSNSKLFIQVLDGATTLCSEPFIDDGVTKGRYSTLEKLPFTSSDFLLTKFRGSSYSRIRCNTSDASGNDRVVDGNDYTVRVLDSGVDGVAGTADDVVAYTTTETASVVPLADRYTQAFDVTGIVVDGVSASAQAGSSEVLLPGYYNVNRSTVMNISWPVHPEGADSYQLLVQPLDAIDDFEVLYNRGTNSISNVNVGLTGNQGRTLRITARKDVANGARALAEARKLLILNGVSGAFTFDLGNTIDSAYKNMTIIIQGTGSMNTCNVIDNANISCNAAGSSVDFTNNIVSLNMTDVTGTLVGAGNTFTLQLHFFQSSGSATAVVTSPNGILGIPTSAVGATTSAVLIP